MAVSAAGITLCGHFKLRTRVYAHALLVLDDHDFHERQAVFSLGQQRAIATALNSLVFRTHCRAPGAALAQRANWRPPYPGLSLNTSAHIARPTEKIPVRLTCQTVQRGKLLSSHCQGEPPEAAALPTGFNAAKATKVLAEWSTVLLRALHERDVRWPLLLAPNDARCDICNHEVVRMPALADTLFAESVNSRNC